MGNDNDGTDNNDSQPMDMSPSASSEKNDAAAVDASTTTASRAPSALDPLFHRPDKINIHNNNNNNSDDVVRCGDWILLQFADGKSAFGLAQPGGQMKLLKRHYPTANLVGLPYGTVVEVDRDVLLILPPGAPIVPPLPETATTTEGEGEEASSSKPQEEQQDAEEANSSEKAQEGKTPNDDVASKTTTTTKRDNRNLIDTNDSQALEQDKILRLKKTMTGSKLVQHLVDNSATFAQKTDFSRQKYILKKQRKYQPRCRLVKCTARTVARAIFEKQDPKKFTTLRPDTLAQILAYSNVTAGARCLVWEQEGLYGLLTASVAERLAGYGRIFSLYQGQQPNFHEMMQRFNFSFAIQSMIYWVHLGDVKRRVKDEANKEDKETNDNGKEQGNDMDVDKGGESKPQSAESSAPAPAPAPASAKTETEAETTPAPKPTQKQDEQDVEAADRDAMEWPCPLQDHTRRYLKSTQFCAPKQEHKREQMLADFMQRRYSRFVRKLTRPSPMECAAALHERQCDSLILAVRQYDVMETLQYLLPHLAPSCPFVVFCEYIEPLTAAFHWLQEEQLALHMRLMCTWTREYQVLPERTHPAMNMNQNGGYLLTGVKLDPTHGKRVVYSAQELQQIRAERPSRRGHKRQKKTTTTSSSKSSS